jgi:hypothetical protein
MSYNSDPLVAGVDRHLDSLDIRTAQSAGLLEELVKAGFGAEDLKQAGFDLRSLKAAGFQLRQLKGAGFALSKFKDAYTFDELKTSGFTAEELKLAGFDLSCMKDAGFNSKQLKDAGFDATAFTKFLGFDVAELKNAGFSAKEIVEAQYGTRSRNLEIESRHHQLVRELIDSRIRSGHIFGHTWVEFFGFFAPYGTKNSFWSRLKSSPMLRHIFVFSPDYIQEIGRKTLSEETPSPQITVSDIDSSVNNCALICALLIGIPAGIVSNMGDSDLYTNMITSGSFLYVPNCTSSNWERSTFPDACIASFKFGYQWLVGFTIASFYTNIFSLLMAVLYYMCRPSESYNICSNITLLEAFTLEVRNRIRAERHPNTPESEKPPTAPFDNPVAESEVFLKASYLAHNEAEEQMNQEFYMWYKSESFLCEVG